MKKIGIILIVLGIAMFIFKGISYTKVKNVADIGPIEINTKEHKRVSWPLYAGGIAVAAGLVVILVDRKGK